MSQASGLIRLLASCAFLLIFGLAAVFQANAQSQALNGQIEGTITDPNGAAVPNASVTVRNIETGAERQVTTDENGVYRAPLLPLGTWRVTVEAANFKRFIREGITLTAGQNATVDLALEAGDVSATVTVTSDAPIADPGKIDVGRVMTTREIKDLPLVSRNPYNFSLLQANVTGRPNSEFGVPRVSANGYARRTNFQLDGNANTQANQGGLRLVPISETFISEVQLVTNGFSAEFGNTPGLVMNNITPSGTNGFHGSASYRFRRTGFSSRPFNAPPADPKPSTKVDDFTLAIGGPIIKDRWHFYGGYEFVKRDLSGRPDQQIRITESNRQQLIAAGVPSSIFAAAIPASQKVNFFIFRTDAQINEANRLTGRYIRFTNFSPNNIAGNLNTLDRVIDLDDKSNSLAIQLASILTPNVFNEFRYQRAHRNSGFLRNELSGTGPSIIITGVANFGSPTNAGSISPIQTQNQFQNNLTWTRGEHAMKFGGGLNKIYDFRRADVSAVYTFSSIENYRLARIGTTPRGYTSYTESLGEPEIEYRSTFYNLFAQDDWKATRKLKVNYGLRYDFYDVPDGISDAALPFSQTFKDDKNNFAPRLGVVYSLREGNLPTVVRASAGVYYDTVYLAQYERALLNNGLGRYRNFNIGSGVAGAPAFPGTIGSIPAGAPVPIQSLDAVSQDFETMYAMHYQAQIEQALSENLSITAGYIHSNGRHLPVYRNINCLPLASQGTLADGRPIYGARVTAANGNVTIPLPCSNRVFPQFQNILMVESVGNSVYDALTLQLNKRFSQGYQFALNYTLSRAKDDAAEQNLQGVGAVALSDPSNRARDYGYSVADQRHTFSASFVARPQFDVENKVLRYILNNNQFGAFALAGSGETYNIITSLDLNGDGVAFDRPVGFERNGGRAPATFNVDFRYSRIVPITERFRVELFAEASNIFNINRTINFNTSTLTATNVNTSVVNPLTGQINGSIPFPVFAPLAQESRQGQLGIKFIF
ncbi:MAG TPA: TonB-dependent receptor [Pyrinomonadaceae bacterium]|jgi:hypothetical protein